MSFTVRSDNPQRLVFLKALCQEFNNQSPNVVKIHRKGNSGSWGMATMLVHEATDTGLRVSPFYGGSDTVSDDVWEIPYEEIFEIDLP